MLFIARNSRCIYRCRICKDDEEVRNELSYFTSKRVAKAHIIKRHFLGVRDYCRRYGNLRVLDNFTTCQV